MLRMKAVLAAVLALVGTAMSQYQSFYAGGGWAYPGPLPQFAANPEEGLADRVGQASATTTTTTTMSPEEMINSQVASWPEDRQPFWFVNRQHIQEHLGRPQQEQSTQRQPQNQPDTQTQGQDTQRQPENQPATQPQPQPQPQGLPNTRSQPPRTQADLPKQPEGGSQVQDNWPQAQNQPDANRVSQWWLQNQFFAQRQQQPWGAQNQPDTQAQNTEERYRWRGRPGTKTVYRRQ